MSESKHTLGPWYPGHLGSDSTCQCRSIVDDGKYCGAIASVHVGNGLPIGEGGNDAPPADEAAANMHLIAAAPDLLAVCREFISVLGPEGYHPTAGKTATDRMRAAIAKAEGRS